MFKKALLVLYAITLSIQIPLHSDTLTLIRPITLDSAYFESNRHTQVETYEEVSNNPYLENKDLLKVSENEDFILYVDETILSIYVYQKNTGYTWSSTINKDYNALDDEDNPLYPELYNETNRGLKSTLWRNKIDSPLWIGYFTSSADNPQFKEEHLFDNRASSFTLSLKEDGFEARLYFAVSKIFLTLKVRLDEQGITYKILDDSILEQSDAILAKVAVYPFFGAAMKDQIDGYTMIPDGIGALIRYDETPFTSIYEKPFYGQDFAVNQNVLDSNAYQEENLSLNTYGVIHGVNQQGYLKIVSGTPEYASLIVYPAGVITDFNFSYTAYTLRSNYRQPLNQSQSNSILRVQEDMNPVLIEEHIIFLSFEEANYIGMVKHYQDYLKARGDFKDTLTSSPSLHLDILLSENKKAFIGNDTFIMTSISDVLEMVKTLKESGIENITLTLRGTAQTGYTNSTLSELPLGRHTGSNDDYEALFALEYVDTYLYIEPMKAYDNALLGTSFDLSLGRNLLPYRSSDTYGSFSYIHPETYLKKIDDIASQAKALGFKGIMLDRAGYTLYSSFSNQVFSRRDAKEALSDLLSDQGVISGYDFSFKANIYKDITLDHSLHMKFSDTIPFLSYVLAPYKEVYSKPFNLYASSRLDILRLLDFNIMPSYLVTKESAIKLLDTASSHFFSTQFSIWKDTILDHYLSIFDTMQQVRGSLILSREILDAGMVKITYQNGYTLYINYLNEDMFYDNVRIEALNFSLVGGKP